MSFRKKIAFLYLLKNHPLYVFHLITKKIRFGERYRWILRNADKDAQVPAPLVYELTLTLKCNLRCKMCMQWGDVGWCGTLGGGAIKDELPLELIRSLISSVRRNHPSFILHGGEPCLHTQFGEIVRTLKDHRLFSILCTNGTLLDRSERDISNNPFLDILISLDGLREENDLIRGSGTYDKVVANIRLIKRLRRPPHLGIQCTIMPENVSCLYEFCREMVRLGVDWILLNPCWSFTENQKVGYEKFMKDNFNIVPTTHLGYLRPYKLNPDDFAREYARIKNDKWPIQIGCYLKNPCVDIYPYVNSPDSFTGNTFCYKQWVRMDLTPKGEVTACMRYPDLIFGNLKDSSVFEVWNCEKFRKFRGLIRKNPLSICNKCNCLYLYDAKRRYL